MTKVTYESLGVITNNNGASFVDVDFTINKDTAHMHMINNYSEDIYVDLPRELLTFLLDSIYNYVSFVGIK